MGEQPYISDEEFMKDAEEGLSAIDDKNRLSMIVDQLNQDLHKRLEQKKARKNRRKLKDYSWIYLAIILIILLVVIAYLVIHKMTT
jgi:t-SNARE complex subunit (syntaxin)